MARTLRSPDGRTWTVGRRLLPWRPQGQGSRTVGRLSELGILPDFELGGTLALAAGALVAASVLVFVFLPTTIFLLEAFLVVLLVGMILLARTVVRRPWIVDARTDGPPRELRSWAVVGWRASATVVQSVARAVAFGEEPALGPGVHRLR